MNRKEKFLRSLYDALSEFEDSTGVEVFRITINRVDVGMGHGEIAEKSVVESIELEMA